ncbi:AAA family ATPase, partial [Paenibacillus glycinis]
MRLKKAHAEGFGKLSDFACELDAPFTVVYGPNEAGKSTMLGFIRTMLFGFANKGSLTERLEPVNGGRHGGRLFFDDEAGRSHVMERYGNASGKVLVRRIAEDGADGDSGGRGETLMQPQWERMYLGGVGERVFRELFAITLTELQAVGMLEGDELGKQLYHAGWNGGSAIVGAEKQLQGGMDELFKPRGSNQRMSKLLKALDETEEELRRMEDGIAEFNGLTSAIEAAENELAELDGKRAPLREMTDLLARAVDIRPTWLSRSALLQELEGLRDVPRLAGDARSRWEALAAELRRAREELREADELAAVLEGRIERLHADQELLDRKADIETLMLSAEQTAAARQSVFELEAEAGEHAEAARRLLRRISPAWTEASLRVFHAGVADREAIRVHRSALQEAEKALHLAEAAHRAAAERQEDAARQLAATEREAAQQLPESERHAHRRPGDPESELSDGAPNGSAERDSATWHWQAGGEALSEIFRLLPATADALRYAARRFEDAWRELELAELRERHEAEAAAPAARSRGAGFGGGAGYWAAAGVLAAGAAALAAAGMPAAAAAAGAAAV